MRVRKFILGVLLFLSLFLPIRSEAANKMWWAPGLTGGGTALDGIDGASLTIGDGAIVIMDNAGAPLSYIYRVYESGTAESSPNVIAPNTNPGNMRWHLVSMTYVSGLVMADKSIIQWTGVGTAEVLTCTAAGQLIGVNAANTALECKSAIPGVTITGGTANTIGVWQTDNTMCTASGVPIACCTGSGTGTCVGFTSNAAVTASKPLCSNASGLPVTCTTEVGALCTSSHDYGGAATAWTMSASEATCSYISVTNANGVVDAVLPAAVPGKMFMVNNGSGYVLTFKVTGQTGGTIANGKWAVYTTLAADVAEIYELP